MHVPGPEHSQTCPPVPPHGTVCSKPEAFLLFPGGKGHWTWGEPRRRTGEPGAVVDFLQVTTYLPILGLPLMLGVILIRRSLLASFTPLRPGGDRSPPGVSALG